MNPHHHSTLGAFKQTTLKSHINLAKPAASLALSHFSTSQIYAVLSLFYWEVSRQWHSMLIRLEKSPAIKHPK